MTPSLPSSYFYGETNLVPFFSSLKQLKIKIMDPKLGSLAKEGNLVRECVSVLLFA